MNSHCIHMQHITEVRLPDLESVMDSVDDMAGSLRIDNYEHRLQTHLRSILDDRRQGLGEAGISTQTLPFPVYTQPCVLWHVVDAPP